MTFTTTRSRASHLCVTSVENFTFSVYEQPLSSYRPACDKGTIWPKIIFNSIRGKVPHICTTSTHEPQISIHPFSSTACTKWPQNNLEHYKVKAIHAASLVKGSHVGFYHASRLFELQAISRYRLVKNRKCTEWPQNELNLLCVNSTLYTLNTHSRSPNFTPFHSTTRRFWDTRLSKIGNAPNDPRMTFST